MKSKNSPYNSIFNFRNFKLRLVIEGVIVGFFTGCIISLFRFVVDKSGIYLNKLYHFLSLKPLWIPVWAVILIILGYLMGTLIKKDPMVSGGGISQVEGVILRKLDMKWIRVIFEKFIGSVVSIASGLSLGIEGPSVQIGAAAGQGVGSILKKTKIEQKYLITSGVSAGISAAFNAPLAGTMFALEEVHKNFSPLILVSSLSSALSADFISREFFGMKPVFNFKNVSLLPLNYYLYIIIFGIIIGIAGAGFNKALLKAQKIYSNLHIKVELRTIIPFIISIPVAFMVPQALGEGNSLIMSLTKEKWAFKALLIVLIAKFLFTMVSAGSGTPGGIFLPLFAIGAIIGCIYGNILTCFFGIKSSFIANFVIFAMAGYFGAVVKSPITGSILVMEMTGTFGSLLPACMMSIIAYITSDILNVKPIYQALLERFLKSSTNENIEEGNKRKSVLEIPISIGSGLSGKKIKDIKWPKKCLIISIKRGDSEIIPEGENIIYPGDYLVILTNENISFKMNSVLKNMAKPV